MARSSLLPLVAAGLLLIFLTTSSHPATADEQHHFVLVHGFGHGAWCWYKITTLLQAAGQRVTPIDLASNGISKVVADTITTVAQYLQPLTQFLANEVQAPNKVILVGHSLGGSAITYAMEQFSEKIDKAIFLVAFMPLNNQTYFPTEFLSLFEEYLEEGYIIQNFANGPLMPPTSVSINLTSARDLFYNESPLEDVNLAKVLLNPTPYAPLGEVLTLTPTRYGSIKRFYIGTGLDNTLSPSLQDTIIQQNPPKEVFIIEQSDHSTFFSYPIILNYLLLSIATTQLPSLG